MILKQKLKEEIRRRVPRLTELSFGCMAKEVYTNEECRSDNCPGKRPP
jgi:hypothetical protein